MAGIFSISSYFCSGQVQLQNKAATPAGSASNTCGCDFFPLCSYDVTKTFNGVVWRGLTNDDGITTYYLCKNGILQEKVELFDNFTGDLLGYETFTSLKFNEPTGYTWKETSDINGVKGYFTHTILAKDTTVSIKGRTYKHVMKVYRQKSVAMFFQDGKPLDATQIESNNLYYAKYEGLVLAEYVEPAPHKTNISAYEEAAEKYERQLRIDEENKKLNAIKQSHALLKGQWDDNLKGLWKTSSRNRANVNVFEFIRFNEGGTVDYFESSVGEDKWIKNILYRYDYRIEGNTFMKVPNIKWAAENVPEAAPEYYKLVKDVLVKTNEIRYGKPVIKINGLTYIYVNDNK